MADFEKVYSIKFNTRKAQNALEKLDKSLVGIEKESKEVGKKFERFVGGKGVKATEKLNRSLKRTNKNVDGLNTKLKSFGRNMRRYVTLPLIAAGAVATKWARDMNRGMARVATLIPNQLDRVKELKFQIQELAKETGVATGDLTDGAYAAISAWGDGAETMNRLRVVAQASQAGLATTDQTLGLLAQVTENYGDSSAKATERVADFAFVTNKLAKEAPFAEMAASMGKVIPVAKQLGVSQEDLFSTLAAGAGITGNVAEVVTQMRSLYTTALKETPQMSKIVKAAGFDSAEEMMGKLGTKGYIDVVKKHTANTKEFTKAMGGRTEGLVLAFALAGARAEKYNEALTEMTENTGQMRVAHKEITDGINREGHALERTKQRVVVFAQRVGDKLLPVLGRLFKHIEPLLEKIENMDDATLEAGLKFAGFVAAAGPAVGILAKMSGSIGAMAMAKGGLQGTAGVLSGIMRGFNVALGAGTVGAAMLKLLEYKAGVHRGKVESYEERGLSAKRVARSKTKTIEEKEAYLQKLKGEHKQFVGGRTPIYEIPQAVGALLSGGETPAQSFRRRKAAGEAGIRALESEVQGTKMAQWHFRGETTPSNAPAINITVGDLNVSGQGLNAEQVDRKLRRTLKQTLTEEARKISTMSHQLVPAQQ